MCFSFIILYKIILYYREKQGTLHVTEINLKCCSVPKLVCLNLYKCEYKCTKKTVIQYKTIHIHCLFEVTTYTEILYSICVPPYIFSSICLTIILHI